MKRQKMVKRGETRDMKYQMERTITAKLVLLVLIDSRLKSL